MADCKKYEPIFGAWYIKRKIGKGSFGEVYEIEREEFGRTYHAALKTITIPNDNDEITTLKYEGMTNDSISTFYTSVVKDIISEYVLMNELKGTSNIVSYEDHVIIDHEDGIGKDILIKMELLKPIRELYQNKLNKPEEVIRLGIGICRALELCHSRNIIHRDIKPENIMISDNGDYKLGDFGVARTIEKTTGGMSIKGTYNYMAPEVYRGQPYGKASDIYSLGVVMYTLLNGNRAPFLKPAPEEITYNDKEISLMRRMSGETLPAITGIDEALMQVVLKACEANPAERYSSANELRDDLEKTLGNITFHQTNSFDEEITESLNYESDYGTNESELEETVCIDVGTEEFSETVVLPEDVYSLNRETQNTQDNIFYTSCEKDVNEDSGTDSVDNNINEIRECSDSICSEIKSDNTEKQEEKKQKRTIRKKFIFIGIALLIIAVASVIAVMKPFGNSEPVIIPGNEIEIQGWDWDWGCSDKKYDTDLSKVSVIMEVKNNSNEDITSFAFNVYYGKDQILNFAEGCEGHAFLAVGYIPAGDKGVMVADIVTDKRNTGKQYKVSEADILKGYVYDSDEHYSQPEGVITGKTQDNGGTYSIKVANNNNFNIRPEDSKVVVVGYSKETGILEPGECCAKGTLNTELCANNEGEATLTNNPGFNSYDEYNHSVCVINNKYEDGRSFDFQYQNDIEKDEI